MRLPGLLICLLIILFIAPHSFAAPGRTSEIRGKSETGKVQLIIKTSEIDAGVVDARLVLDRDTTDFLAGCDAYTVIDPASHLITIIFQQRGISPGTPNAKWLKIWATPASFVKMVEGPDSWRFKLKLTGSMVRDVTTLDCVYMRVP